MQAQGSNEEGINGVLVVATGQSRTLLFDLTFQCKSICSFLFQTNEEIGWRREHRELAGLLQPLVWQDQHKCVHQMWLDACEGRKMVAYSRRHGRQISSYLQ